MLDINLVEPNLAKPGREVAVVLTCALSHERQPWFNFYSRLFRAKESTAKLMISDWAGEDEPGGPVGQELLYNFIEVQPYFDVDQ